MSSLYEVEVSSSSKSGGISVVIPFLAEIVMSTLRDMLQPMIF